MSRGGHDQAQQEVSRYRGGGLLMQLNEGELWGLVDGEHMQLARSARTSATSMSK
ncbi:hypothetical protein [Mesorhizobium sp. 43Arga]